MDAELIASVVAALVIRTPLTTLSTDEGPTSARAQAGPLV
ncbi:hypothetical protein SACT1_0216 [Streptomyces sp. ACT-1]|nr:hypothetical protein SACT1_0216 [Streptomyces sp. ACT-1]